MKNPRQATADAFERSSVPRRGVYYGKNRKDVDKISLFGDGSR
jgi:hypothetical protein